MGRYAIPTGRIVKGFSVLLRPSPEQAARFRRDDGARRFAYNWAVGEFREAFSRGRETGEHDPVVWSHYELRKRWNRTKGEIAPWWPSCSKEAFSNGIADAVVALKNWHASKTGKREGPRMGFPRFRKKGKDPVRCTYTTGALRVEDCATSYFRARGASRPRRTSVLSSSTCVAGPVDCWRLRCARRTACGACR